MYDEFDKDIDWLAVYEKLAAYKDILHEGTPHEGSIPHSGRYPFGSGLAPYQREMTFNKKVNDLRKQGVSWAEIADGFGMSINQVRAKMSENNAMYKTAAFDIVKQMLDAGYERKDIAQETGMNYSTISSMIKSIEKGEERKERQILNTKAALKQVLDEGNPVDYGQGVERYLGVSQTALTKAARLLEMDGYENYEVSFPQTTNQNQYTQMRVLAPKGMSKEDILNDMTQIKLPFQYSENGGDTFETRKPPVNIDRDRIFVRYAEDGGKDRDGTIELRRGVPDIDLGYANYAQVRIAVEGDKYMKGMAFYSDDIPDGYDIVYNTNKKRGTPDFKYDPYGNVKGGVFKEQDKEDIYNPFGASIKDEDELKLIKTKTYIDKNGKKQQSALNIISEEGDWENWSNTLASQFLSKQTPKLAKQQLDKAYKEHIQEYNEIMSVTNPYVKEKLLQSFADGCDSDAVHLKAAALPRQGVHVILPGPKLKENEIFAPRYNDGEEVVLVRYPHGGTFEIPRLIVNNQNKDCIKKYSLNAKDVIAISSKAASQLSGADFDGDTALVIPTKGKDILSRPYLEGLKDFDQDIYNRRDVDKKYRSLTKKNKGMYMGVATNLITDMSLQNPTEDELVRAIKYSMVVIDSPKHDLDHRFAYKELGIGELKKKYQPDPTKREGGGGTHTLISRAKSPAFVKDRQSYYRIDKETGEKIFYGKSKDGKLYRVELGEDPGYGKKLKSTQMYETKDARTLSSGTKMENIYADYANSLKALGDKARLSSLRVGDIPYSKSAAGIYEKEVTSLKNKLDRANMNAPIERQANLIANKQAQLKLDAKADYDKDDVKKIHNLCIKEARLRLGAKHYDFNISPEEWEAINSGAVNKSTQKEIFKKVDDEVLKEATMPRKRRTMSDNQRALARQLSASGYSLAEISDRLGFSTSAIADAIK